MLTAKENLLTCLRGEMPEWVPRYTMGLGENPSDIMIEPAIISLHRKNSGGKDIWGVRYIPTESTGNALIPDNSEFILDDIRNWRDIIKAPDISGVDWEQMAKDDLAARNVNRDITAVSCNLHIGYFQNLMAFMGFTNGLMAFYEEPDEVHALFEYLCDFYCAVAEKYIDHIKPDVWGLVDDTAAWNNPFISPAMYKEFLIPCYDRQAKFARDRGIPISMHNCGKAEGFIDDLVDIGVCAWDPAQTCNDLLAIKAKYGRRLVICGGWDARDNLLKEELTYEEIYDSLKASFDKLAPGGGYCFCGGFLGRVGDDKTLQKNRMVRRAAEELGHKYY